MKLIRIKSCQECPYNGECQSWRKLSSAQRVTLTYGVGVPDDFILKDCHLDDDPQAETNTRG